MDPQSTPLQGSRTASRTIEGRAVVVVIDRQKLHALNEVGTRVWELLDGRPLQSLATALAEEYEVEPAVVLHDVQRFVRELVELGAVTLEYTKPSDRSEQGPLDEERNA